MKKISDSGKFYEKIKKVMGQRGTILGQISMKAISENVPFKLKPE